MVELQAPAPAIPDTVTAPPAWSRARDRLGHVDAAAVAAWALAFLAVTYLALRGGGYDIVVRSEAGIVIWWIVLLGALAGVLPARVGRWGWISIGLLAGFAAWTALAISWSQSAEQSVIEVGRIGAYLAVLVLAIAVQGRAAARHTINGLACAIGLVTVLAVLSRLHPQAFGPGQHFQFLGPESARKLSYPLNYWNALADFAAMGVPLLLTAAAGARTLAGRALAAAVLPLSAVCVYLTISRGGAVAIGVGIAVFLVLAPRRLETLATLLVAAAGTAALLQAIAGKTALTSGVPSPTAIHQGTLMLWLSLIVCGAVGIIQVAIALAARHPRRPPVLSPGRRTTTRVTLALVAGALVLAVAVGAPGKLDHAWHDFKQPSGVVAPGSENSVFTRLQAANGNSRYQIWQAALHANATDPWRGIGPGTFQFWWTQHPTAPGFIRNAHSLYFETLAETGIVGLALLGGLLLCFVAVAVCRALREPPALRLWLAGASASLAVFLFSAAVEWVWQLAAIAAAALILGAVIVAGRGEPSGSPADTAVQPRSTARMGWRRLVPRATLVLLSVAALGAVLVPLAGTLAVRASQTAATAGQLGAALSDSLAAERLQPYSASAYLQETLVLEAAGDFAPAAAAARVATTDSPTDWTMWLTLARIDARRGATRAALAELRRAHQLNPRSILFQSGY